MNTQSILLEADKLWDEGKYEEGLTILRSAYLVKPDDPALAYQFGHMLGEFASLTDDSQSLRDEAVLVLTKLCDVMQGLDPMEQWKIRRHLYLYSGKHLENIALGHAEIARGNALGIQSVGFGCLHQALHLIEEGKLLEARLFAKDGAEAFQTLLTIDAPRPGRYLAWAQTLGILGHRDEAFVVTRKAAQLLSKDVDDLKDHVKELERLLALAQKSDFKEGQ
jgi:tetratricopeptide (TPR) repeat protein